MTRGRLVLATITFVLVAGLFASYWRGGLVAVLLEAAGDPAGLDALRTYVLSFGAAAPVVYILATAVEVIVAPIPGLLLYAPGGAIFGGWYGGTLSLVGNAIGALVAALVGRLLGEPWVTARFGAAGLGRLRDRTMRHAIWIIVLLRLNPFTSTDLVSYAAGALGVSPWRVAVGTALGMAPLCYLQAHGSEWLFGILPAPGALVLGLSLAYVAVVVWLVMKKPVDRPREEPSHIQSDS